MGGGAGGKGRQINFVGLAISENSRKGQVCERIKKSPAENGLTNWRRGAKRGNERKKISELTLLSGFLFS